MTCCYSGFHECSLCLKDFGCGGAGGMRGDICTEYGVTACRECEQYAPKSAACWTCFEFFKTTNDLFAHLHQTPTHQRDKPEVCLRCNMSFVKTDICGHAYGFFSTYEVYFHYIFGCSQKNTNRSSYELG